MTQPKSQPARATAAESARVVTGNVSASIRSMRTVAMSLLVDRALSA
ncbi:hypothetical protein PQQ51_28995 [Paraburkholderia xenovorans]